MSNTIINNNVNESKNNKSMKKHKNIFVIGNGADCSLQLPSGFSQYANSKYLNDEHTDIKKYINLFYKFRKEISKEMSHVINTAINLSNNTNISMSDLSLNWVHQWINSSNIKEPIYFNKLASDYLNLKLYFKDYFTFPINYNITQIKLNNPKLKKSINDSHNSQLRESINDLNNHINKVNSLGDTALKSLSNIITEIKANKINLWVLLIIFQEIKSNSSKETLRQEFSKFTSYIQSLNPKMNSSVLKNNINKIITYLDTNKISLKSRNKNLHDITSYCNKNNININENILNHLFDISMIQKSIDIVSYGANWSDVENTIKYFLISLSDVHSTNDKHNLSYYFNHTNGFDDDYFESYIFINEYLNSLKNLSYSYTDYISRSHNINYNNPYSQSTNLYDFLVNKNNFNESIMYMYDILLPKENLMGSLYRESLVFIIQSIFGQQLFTSNLNNDYSDFTLFSLKYLSGQLSKFEHNFRKYLISLIPNKSKYIKDSHNLLSKINNKISTNKKYEVLDFNYTPLSKKITTKEHIHGSLHNNNIIIGVGDIEINNLINKINKEINYTNKLIMKSKYSHNIKKIHDLRNYKQKQIRHYNYYQDILIFTKTHRILKMNNKDKESSFNDTSFNNISNIIFFGHSLGVNDYPYLDALFDRTNIYNSHTKLIFCYSKFYKEDDENIRKNNQVSSIIKLLKQYGKTMNNNNHGENLISKMLMENRIQFISVTSCINDVKPLKSYKPHY